LKTPAISGASDDRQRLIDAANAALQEHGLEGIGRTQFFEDMKVLAAPDGWKAEITTYKEGRQTFYRYADPNFSIRHSLLNSEQVLHLQAAVDVLASFQGLPQFDFTAEAISALDMKLLPVRQAQEKIVDFDSSLHYKGRDWVMPLYNAIRRRECLLLEYLRFYEEKPDLWHVSPAFLRQYNGRWFVIGYNHDTGLQAQRLALDRIEKISACNVPYQSTDIDWEKHFSNIVGVTKFEDREEVEIKLLFSRFAAPYVLTRPLHALQQTETLADGRLLLSVRLIPNYELEQRILGYAEQVEVVAPEHLRRVIAHRLRQALDFYM